MVLVGIYGTIISFGQVDIEAVRTDNRTSGRVLFEEASNSGMVSSDVRCRSSNEGLVVDDIDIVLAVIKAKVGHGDIDNVHGPFLSMVEMAEISAILSLVACETRSEKVLPLRLVLDKNIILFLDEVLLAFRLTIRCV